MQLSFLIGSLRISA